MERLLLFLFRLEVFFLNSIERKEKRYLRRKNKRLEKNISRSNLYGNINTAFCFHKVMYYADLCCKGVSFKRSTQNFKLHLFTTIATTCRNIKENKYKVSNTYQFIIHERGKIRVIDAPYIKDRLVHKVLSNEIINPIYLPHFIYDNGASVINKGFHFSMKRVKEKLRTWYRRYGYYGYICLVDFSKFFPNCSHDVIRSIHKRYILNSYTRKVIEDYLFIKPGLSLGCEIAQKEALMLPNILDHYIANKYPIVRFMDDSFFIVKNKEEASSILEEYEKLASSLKIIINKKKTKIIPITEYFTFCKWKYKLLDDIILCIPCKDTLYRDRRKLRKMIRLSLLNSEIYTTYVSFLAYLSIGNSYRYCLVLKNIYSFVKL